MYNKLRDFGMPEESCIECHEHRYGEKLKSNGWCTRCHKSAARRRQLSPNNDMDLGDLPDELKGLCLVEKLAISLVSPIYIIHYKNNKYVFKTKIRIVCVEFLAYISFIFRNKSDDYFYLYIRNLENIRLK